VVQLNNLFNYPNPSSDITHFVFEHNHPNETLKAQLYIYNLSGALVRTLAQDFIPTGSRSYEITWDGTGDTGAKLSNGLYVYKLNIITSQGVESTAYQKLVLLR
jgi:flagellar hook assembly protein FlgD